MVSEILKIIELRIHNEWTYSPVAWMNVEYLPTRGQEFIEPIIVEDNSDMLAGISHNGLFRTEGSLHLIISVPAEAGANRAMFLASELANIFRGYQEDGLFMGAPAPIRLGENQEWYKVNLIIPFFYDACLDNIGGAYSRLDITNTVEVREDVDLDLPASVVELDLQNLINTADLLNNERGYGYGHEEYGQHGYGGKQ